MKYCTKCGRSMADDDRFCPQCGNDTQQVAPQAGYPAYSQPAYAPATANNAPPVKQKSNAGVIIAIIVGVLVVVGTIFLVWWLSQEEEVELLDGTYISESGRYTIDFDSDGTLKWYQDNTFFKGEYSYDGEVYTLEVIATANYISSVFEAVPDGDDLIITGGVVYGERFIEQ